MKKIIENIWEFFCALGRARYAAELVRNGRIEEAKKIYNNV